MANSSNIRAGRAYVELVIKDGIAAGLEKARKKISAFGSVLTAAGAKLAGAGAALLGPLGLASQSYAAMGDELDKMSRRTGVSVESLSELGHAAKLAGTDLNTVEAALRRSQRVVGQAAAGSASAAASLADLGLSVADLQRMDPEAQFLSIADAVAAIPDQARRTAAAMQAFGRSGTMLLPMLEGGAGSVRGQMGDARKFGLTISTRDAQAAAEYNDVLDTLRATARRVAFAIGSALQPTMQKVAEVVTKATVAAREWIDQHRGIVNNVLAVAAGAAAAGGVLLSLGMAAKLAAGALGLLSGALGIVKASLAAVGFVLGVLTTPLGILAAALAGVGVVFVKFTKTGQQAASWIMQRFKDLASFASETFGAIGDALAAGDIQAAAKVLWAGLKLAWMKGVEVLQESWIGLKKTSLVIMYDIAYGTLAGVSAMWYGVRRAYVEGAAFVSKVMYGLVAVHKTVTEALADHFTQMQINMDEGMGTIDAKEAEWRRQQADRMHERAGGAITEQLVSDLTALEVQRREDAARARGDFDKSLADIRARSAATSERLASRSTEDVQKAQADLSVARAEWQAAILAARNASSKLEAPALAKFKPAGLALETAAGKFTSAGTFNPFAAMRMGSGGIMDRLVQANEKTAANTKRIADGMDDGAVFD